jgi:hypothetical protein
MFSGCTALRVPGFALSNLSRVTNTTNMFFNCTNLIDSGLNSATVRLTNPALINMSGMFSGCTVLTTPGFAGSNLSSVTDMSQMFLNCGQLVDCGLNLDISAITIMSGMFNGCALLKTTGLTTADVSKVTNMNLIFTGCPALEDDLSSWNLRVINPANVTNLPSFDNAYITTRNPKFSTNQNTWTFGVTGATDEQILTQIVGANNIGLYKLITRDGNFKSILEVDNLVIEAAYQRVFNDIACDAIGTGYGVKTEGIYRFPNVAPGNLFKSVPTLNTYRSLAVNANSTKFIAGGFIDNVGKIYIVDDNNISTLLSVGTIAIISVSCNCTGDIVVACSESTVYIIVKGVLFSQKSNLNLNIPLLKFRQVACNFKGDVIYAASSQRVYKNSIVDGVPSTVTVNGVTSLNLVNSAFPDNNVNYPSVACGYNDDAIACTATDVHKLINGQLSSISSNNNTDVFCNGELTKYGYTGARDFCRFEYTYDITTPSELSSEHRNNFTKGCCNFNGNIVYMLTGGVVAGPGGPEVLPYVYRYSTKDNFVSTWNVPAGNVIFPLQVAPVNAQNGVIVNWGDNTPDTTYTQTTQISHAYNSNNNIKITIRNAANVLLLGANDNFLTIENCSNNFIINPGAVFSSTSLQYIRGGYNLTIPVNCTFSSCTALRSGIVGASYPVVMRNMFQNCNALIDSGFAGCNLSAVTKMDSMFLNCRSLVRSGLNLASLKITLVNDMTSMFSGCIELVNSGFDGSDLSRVVFMNNMFFNCAKLVNSGLDSATVILSVVANMSGMFSGCEELTMPGFASARLNVVTKMDRMFFNCKKLVTTGLNTANAGFRINRVDDTRSMFEECHKLTDPGFAGCDLSRITNTNRMFLKCGDLVDSGLNLAAVPLAAVTDMTDMFTDCTLLTNPGFGPRTPQLLGSSLLGSSLSNVQIMTKMFLRCTSLQNSTLNLANNKLVNVQMMDEMFSGCSILINPGFQDSSLAAVTDMREMFAGCEALTNIVFHDSINIANKFGLVTDMSSMFQGCILLSEPGFGTTTSFASVQKMNSMFSGCTNSLQNSGLDQALVRIAIVNDMSSMFLNCNQLRNPGFTGANLSLVTTMASMFSGCGVLENSSLHLAADNGKISTRLTNMSNMFKNCGNLRNPGLVGAVLSEVTTMGEMFNGCSVLETAGLANANVINVTTMNLIFNACPAFREDLSLWNLRGIDPLVITNLPKFTTEYINAVKPKFSSNENTWTFSVSINTTDAMVLTQIVGADNISRYKIVDRGGNFKSILIVVHSEPPSVSRIFSAINKSSRITRRTRFR